MTLLSPKKIKLIAITGFIALILLFIGLYYLYIQPLKSTLANKQRELQTSEQLLSVIENQIKETESDTYEGTETLQKKIPVKPLVEQLLLDIDKAETVSGSVVTSMEFSIGDMKEDQPADSTETTVEETVTDQEEVQSNIPMPTGMKKATVVLTVQSANYFEMEKFIGSLESLNRIILVENIQISGQDEIVSANQEKGLIETEITISAFYMPTLTDLIDQLPKMEVPKSSDKKNPFSLSGNILNQGEEGVLKPTQDTNNEQPQMEDQNNIVKYTVQPGDTLYRISMKFFKTRDGEEIIKEWNKLNNEIVKTEQVLEIPLLQEKK